MRAADQIFRRAPDQRMPQAGETVGGSDHEIDIRALREIDQIVNRDAELDCCFRGNVRERQRVHELIQKILRLRQRPVRERRPIDAASVSSGPRVIRRMNDVREQQTRAEQDGGA